MPLIEKVGLAGAYKELLESPNAVSHFHNIIWVVNMTSLSLLEEAATYPGIEFKDHAICAFGTDTKVVGGERKTGSSFSAPTVAGVAALIKGTFPNFTPFYLKTCLLESADKTRIVGEGANTREEPLDPYSYGKGILNAKHAYMYAAALNALRLSYSTLLPDDERVKKAYWSLIEQETAAANDRIKRLLKKSHVYERIKNRLTDQQAIDEKSVFEKESSLHK